MNTKHYEPISDMGRIKESLMSVFFNTQDITRLVMPEPDNEELTFEENWYGRHCFDMPYTEGIMAEDGCVIFIETYLTKVENQRIKEVGVDISVVCHKDFVRLNDADRIYYNTKGIYGNRVDCIIQMIHSSILSPQIMDNIKEKYSIGDMKLSTENNPLKAFSTEKCFYGKSLSYTYQSFYLKKTNMTGR